MRFLIAFVVLACASGVFSAPEPKPDPAGPAAILPPREPTLSPGDINGAAIEVAVEQQDALVEAVDLQRANFDATKEVHDHYAEIQRQQVDAADDQAWKTVGEIQTIEARSDGALQAAAPVLAKQLVRQSGIQPSPGLYGNYAGQRYGAGLGPYGAAPGAYGPGFLGAGLGPLPTALPTGFPTGAPIPVPSFRSTEAPVAASAGSQGSSSDVSSSIAIPDEAPENILNSSDDNNSASSSSSYAGSTGGSASAVSTSQGQGPTAQSAPAVAQGYSAVGPNGQPIYDGYNYNYNALFNPQVYPGYPQAYTGYPQGYSQAYSSPYYPAPYSQFNQNPYYGSPFYNNYNQLAYNPYTPFY